MSIRMIDYYIKGLPFGVRQKLFRSIDDIGKMSVKSLLEYPENYPKLRRMGLDDDKIRHFSNLISQKFSCVNRIMIEHNRPPLFENPFNTYESSKKYVELLVRYHRENENVIKAHSNYGRDSESEKTLVEIMGCTWDDYIPESYQS